MTDHSHPGGVVARLEAIEQDLAKRQNISIEDLGYATPCWIWQRYVAKNGYGQVWDGERVMYAHRHVFRLAHGDLPPILDHLCRNPSCVNPVHLEGVDARTNVRRGARAKLTLEDIDEILASTLSYRALGRRYGVTNQTIAYYKGGAYQRRMAA